jgi:hypothetical protein
MGQPVLLISPILSRAKMIGFIASRGLRHLRVHIVKMIHGERADCSIISCVLSHLAVVLAFVLALCLVLLCLLLSRVLSCFIMSRALCLVLCHTYSQTHIRFTSTTGIEIMFSKKRRYKSSTIHIDFSALFVVVEKGKNLQLEEGLPALVASLNDEVGAITKGVFDVSLSRCNHVPNPNTQEQWTVTNNGTTYMRHRLRLSSKTEHL